MARKCRSWTARRPPSSRRSIASALVQLAASRRFVKILKPVRVEQGRAFSELRPADKGFRLDVEIDFKSEAIGRQRKILDLDPAAFRRELARARTFGFLADVKRLISAGFALGASLENSVGIDDDRVLNPEGLRYSDEFVRHKMLDAVGDLALAGAPLIGEYHSYCGGHKMNVAVLEALFSDRTAYRFVDAAPAPREGVRADLGLVASPAVHARAQLTAAREFLVESAFAAPAPGREGRRSLKNAVKNRFFFCARGAIRVW